MSLTMSTFISLATVADREGVLMDPHSRADLEELLDRLTKKVTLGMRDDQFTRAILIEALAEAGRFETAIELLRPIESIMCRTLAGGYIVEALAREGRMAEADDVRKREPPSTLDDNLLQGKIVQGLAARGDIDAAIERLDHFEPDKILYLYETRPRLACLDALIRADEMKRAKDMMKRIGSGDRKDEKRFAAAWMAIGLHAWGEHGEAVKLALRAERRANLQEMPWIIGTYMVIGHPDDAQRLRSEWDRKLSHVDEKDDAKFYMARAMANVRQYDEALSFAGQIEKGWIAAKAYSCITYVMFNAGERERFLETFDTSLVISQGLDKERDRIHALCDLAVNMAWIQRLGVNVSCATPLIRASGMLVRTA